VGMNAPKLCPALPWKWRWTVSSGSPCQCFLVISLPRMVPTARLTLQIGRVALVGLPSRIESLHRSNKVVISRDLSSP
jgi:hypothetical protein